MNNGNRAINGLQVKIKGLDDFYLNKVEPVKSCLFALRDIVLKHNREFMEAWKYKMPFFCYKGKMFCYLWVEKKTGIPYLGIVDGRDINHPELHQEKRSRMKIMFVDPTKDIPVKTITKILSLAEGVRSKKGS